MNGTLEPYSTERHLALEGLNPVTVEGFKVGDKVRFVADWADDVKAGSIGVITEILDHKIYPVSVTVQRPGGADIADLPVTFDEIALDA